MTEILADIGSNHVGSLKTALLLIDAAATSGADFVKFQLFTGDDLWSPTDSRLEETRKYALPVEWIPTLIGRCKLNKVKFLCTPFSPAGVEILEKNNVSRYKVASGDITYLPLLKAIYQTGKPVYLSVGASTFDEIDKALEVLDDSHVTLLHCVPEYPSIPETANIRRLLDLSERYTITNNIPLGVSSHLKEWWVDAATVCYRAEVIEKHITLDDKGPEAGHSLNPQEFAQFVRAVRDVEKAMKVHKDFTAGVYYATNNYRRS
jgi:sialic acid synthase SpsE